jgi:hypothetical protein
MLRLVGLFFSQVGKWSAVIDEWATTAIIDTDTSSSSSDPTRSLLRGGHPIEGYLHSARQYSLSD